MDNLTGLGTMIAPSDPRAQPAAAAPAAAPASPHYDVLTRMQDYHDAMALAEVAAQVPPGAALTADDVAVYLRIGPLHLEVPAEWLRAATPDDLVAGVQRLVGDRLAAASVALAQTATAAAHAPYAPPTAAQQDAALEAARDGIAHQLRVDPAELA